LKKADKKDSVDKSKSAQGSEENAFARSSRAGPGKAERIPFAPATRLETSNKPKGSRILTNLLRILALFAVIGITLYIYSIRERVEQFAAYGYPGIFLIALLANATILLPAPGIAVIYAMGAIFNPLGVGLAAGAGGTIGCGGAHRCL
jgi:hypothetical protein